ncbi:MAG: PAS domain S-box protein, partial [Sulfuritalea sp.]|nr:PAS domain S-box protein [Sulfuritalea sp.]
MNRGRQSFPLISRWKSFLLDRHPASHTVGEVAEKRPFWQIPLLALICFALIVASTGSAIYLSARDAATRATQNNLEAIARLKVGQIEHWLDRHRNDALLAIDTPLFAAELQRWLKGGMRDHRGRERLLDHLRKVSMAGHYRNVGIRSAADGALLLSSGGMVDAARDRSGAVVAARDMRPVIDDLHFGAADSADIGIDFYFPIQLAGMSQALAVVDIEDSPTEFLFPLLGRWPGSSASAETLIFRTDGADIVYLNKPRHRADAALRFRLPVSTPELLAAQAARGQTGPLVGVDYRDVASLGYALPVAGTSWLMMAKIDAVEAYATLNMEALLTTVVAAILLCLAAWWIFEHSRHAEARHSRHLERKLMDRRIDFLSRYANDTMILADTNGVIIEANDRSLITYGYTHEEMVGMNVIELSAPHLREDVPLILEMITNECRTIETESLRKDGHVFPVELSLRRIEIDGTHYFQGVVRDITERRDAAARIQKLSRLKTAISETNRAIIHSRSPAEVYRAVCRACAGHGGFRLAWVGFANTAAQRIAPVEVAGVASDYIDGIMISTRADVPEGQGPSAIAYRERRMVICNDFFADPATAPWRARAATYGLSSSIALPLLRGGRPYGTLSVYGSERNFFDSESVGLLEAMAENISFAIDQFDLDVQRRRAEHALRQSEEKFRTLVENLPQNIFVKDSDSNYVSCNLAYARALGITPDQISGMTDYDFYPAELAEHYRSDDRRVMKLGKVEDIQEEFVEQGQQKFVHTIKAPFRNEQGQIVGVLGVFWDITERKKLEHEQSRQARRLEELSHRLVAVQEEERQRLAGELHDRASPNLAAIKITLGTLAGALPQQALAAAEASLEDARALLDDTTASIREICT